MGCRESFLPPMAMACGLMPGIDGHENSFCPSFGWADWADSTLGAILL